jgi:hypothetical protein
MTLGIGSLRDGFGQRLLQAFGQRCARTVLS